jgi:phosphoserine phosphatase
MNKETSFPRPHWLLNQSDDKQTEFVVVIVSLLTNDGVVKLTQQFFEKDNIVINSVNVLSNNRATELFISTSTQKAWASFQKLLASFSNEEVDVFVLPVAGRKKKLLICDMDSTIVKTETLDDIAARIGIGEQVSEITARAMQGDLDFRKALDERVSLLKGISENVFAEIAETVQFNLGAELLINSAQEHGIRTVLVSGGFEPVVKVVAGKLGFDRYVCNKTEISGDKLTGKVLEPIVDAKTKLSVLKEESEQLAIVPAEACAVGDGANDLPMLQAAGLGVGFKGKPLVCAGTPHQINSSDLSSILLMMGIA